MSKRKRQGKLHPIARLAQSHGRTYEEQKEAVIKSLKKIQKRIKKIKSLLNVPAYLETDLHKNARAKLVKLEALANEKIFILQYLQARLNSISKREVTKHERRTQVNSNVIVRLEKGKTAPVVQKQIAVERSYPVQEGFNPQVKDHKKSTSKTIVFVDHDPTKPAWDKAKQQWQAIVKEKGDDYNLSQ